MIKKIIIPTDFSEAANNAIEYASRLAQVYQASLLLVNVQTVAVPAANISMGESIFSEAHIEANDAAEKLKMICDTITGTFQVPADYEVEISIKSFVSILDEHNGVDEMIVMGTNGADGLFQFFFGSNTFHVIQHAKCPVLVIPQEVKYADLQKVVFAWNDGSGGKKAFSFLIDYFRPFLPEYVFLHVSVNRHEKKSEAFKVLQEEILLMSEANADVGIKQFFAEEVTLGLSEYVNQAKASMLVLTYHDRGLIGNLVNRKIVRDITDTASFPVLVIQE